MIQSIQKLAPDHIIEWPDGERARVTWVLENGELFRVEGLPTLLWATDSFRVVRRFASKARVYFTAPPRIGMVLRCCLP